MYNYCYLFNYIWHYLSAWDSLVTSVVFLHIVCSDEIKKISFSVKCLPNSSYEESLAGVCIYKE